MAFGFLLFFLLLVRHRATQRHMKIRTRDPSHTEQRRLKPHGQLQLKVYVLVIAHGHFPDHGTPGSSFSGFFPPTHTPQRAPHSAPRAPAPRGRSHACSSRPTTIPPPPPHGGDVPTRGGGRGPAPQAVHPADLFPGGPAAATHVAGRAGTPRGHAARRPAPAHATGAGETCRTRASQRGGQARRG